MAIRMDAEFASKLKAMYIMGGNTEGVGNITVSAELNFHSHPEAAFIVLSNVRCPTYIAPWELCLLETSLEWVKKVHMHLGKFYILKMFNRIGV
jgi:purine nucleosidase